MTTLHMAVAEVLLTRLHARGVVLTVEGDALRYEAPDGALTPDLLDALRSHKAALLALLTPATGSPPPAGEPATTTDAYAVSFIYRMQRPSTVDTLDALCRRIVAGRYYQGLSQEARRGCEASYRVRRRQLAEGGPDL